MTDQPDRPLTRADIVSAVTEVLQSVTVQTQPKPINYTINAFIDKDSTAAGRAQSTVRAALGALREAGLMGDEKPVADGKVPGAGLVPPTPADPAVVVTPEVIEAVAEFLFDTGVDTTMINALRSVAKCLRNDIADPVDYTRQAASRMQQSPGRFSQPRPPGYAR